MPVRSTKNGSAFFLVVMMLVVLVAFVMRLGCLGSRGQEGAASKRRENQEENGFLHIRKHTIMPLRLSIQHFASASSH
jgi:hypothetical protein